MAKTKMAGKFPTFAVILLIIGVVWLMSALNYVTLDVPWIPIILIVVSVGMIFNRHHK